VAAGRAAALVAARAADSRDKRRRALDAVQKLEAAGEPVTFPAVARSARVSTWLVYAPGVREHVEAARRRQAVAGIDTSSTTPLATRTDLGPLRAELIARGSEPAATSCSSGCGFNSVPKSRAHYALSSSPASPSSKPSTAAL
jgi:hypothetical protein